MNLRKHTKFFSQMFDQSENNDYVQTNNINFDPNVSKLLITEENKFIGAKSSEGCLLLPKQNQNLYPNLELLPDSIQVCLDHEIENETSFSEIPIYSKIDKIKKKRDRELSHQSFIDSQKNYNKESNSENNQRDKGIYEEIKDVGIQSKLNECSFINEKSTKIGRGSNRLEKSYLNQSKDTKRFSYRYSPYSENFRPFNKSHYRTRKKKNASSNLIYFLPSQLSDTGRNKKKYTYTIDLQRKGHNNVPCTSKNETKKWYKEQNRILTQYLMNFEYARRNGLVLSKQSRSTLGCKNLFRSCFYKVSQIFFWFQLFLYTVMYSLEMINSCLVDFSWTFFFLSYSTGVFGILFHIFLIIFRYKNFNQRRLILEIVFNISPLTIFLIIQILTNICDGNGFITKCLRNNKCFF